MRKAKIITKTAKNPSARAPRKRIDSLGKKLLEEQIRELISECLETGGKLPTEKQMVERFGVSKTVLREVLYGFESVGLITAHQGSGWYVDTPNLCAHFIDTWSIFIKSKPSLLLDILEIRRVLEQSSLPKVIERLDTEQLQQLGMQVNAMQEKAERGESFAHEDRQFHKILFENSGNIFIEQLLTFFWDVYDQSTISKAHDDLKKIALQHQEMLELLVRRDLQRLTELSKELSADARYRILVAIT